MPDSATETRPEGTTGATPDDATTRSEADRLAERAEVDALLPAGWRAQLRALGTVLALSYRAAPAVFIVLFLLAAVASLSALLTQTYGLKLLVDGAVGGSRPTLLVAASLIALGAAFNILVGRLHVNHAVKLSERAQERIDEELIDLTSSIPGVAHHEWPQYADQLSLLRERRRLLGELPNAITLNIAAVLPLVLAALLLAAIHPALVLLPFFLIPALLLDRRAIAVDERAREASAEQVRERQHLFERATAAGAGQEVRLFGLADELIERHDRVSREFIGHTDRANLHSSMLRVGGAVIFASGFLGAGGLVLWLAMNGRATPGEVVLAIAVARQVNGHVMMFAGFGSYLRLSMKQTTRYLWLLDYSREARRRLTPVDPLPLPAALAEGVTLDHASFRYPGTEAEVLHDISLRLPAGAVVALVGENGAGKTTLVKLLARFYEPTSGSILVDGEPLTSFDPDAWQQSISMAPQDFRALRVPRARDRRRRSPLEDRRSRERRRGDRSRGRGARPALVTGGARHAARADVARGR